MIIEFSVKNFLSFKEEQTLSFIATKDKTYDEYLCYQSGNLRLLKMAVLYGANASGKTNLLKALDFLFQILTNAPNDKKEKIPVKPFIFDKITPNANSEFKLNFLIGGKRYIYSINLNQNYIDFEELKYYPGSQPTLLFKRHYNKKSQESEMKFGDKLYLSQRDKFVLEGNTINNSTIFAAFSRSNVRSELLTNIFIYLKYQTEKIIYSNFDLTDHTNILLANNDLIKEFTVKGLQAADFNIQNFKLIDKNQQINDKIFVSMKNYYDNLDQKSWENKIDEVFKRDIIFEHKVLNEIYHLDQTYQSNGTMRYYGLYPLLFLLFNQYSFLAIDELETSLHFELVEHFLKTFLVNSKNSQLIFTTHNITLLQEDYIRRDCVWFTEKQADGSTELRSAADFDLHKNISLYNAYKIGKLGATPNLGSIFIEKNGKETKTNSF